MYMRKTAHEERRVWGGENLFIRFVMLGESWSLQGIVNDAISLKLRSTNFRKIPRIFTIVFLGKSSDFKLPEIPPELLRVFKFNLQDEFHLRAIMYFPSVHPSTFPDFSISRSHYFPFLYSFWHIFLHILCIKGKEQLAHRKKKYFEERENYLRWIIFKDKEKEFSERFSRSGSLANTKKGEGRKHVAV